ETPVCVRFGGERRGRARQRREQHAHRRDDTKRAAWRRAEPRGDHRPVPLLEIFLAFGLIGPYLLLACFSHARRLLFCLSFLHASSAFASFCARVSGFGGTTTFFS